MVFNGFYVLIDAINISAQMLLNEETSLPECDEVCMKTLSRVGTMDAFLHILDLLIGSEGIGVWKTSSVSDIPPGVSALVRFFAVVRERILINLERPTPPVI